MFAATTGGAAITNPYAKPRLYPGASMPTNPHDTSRPLPVRKVFAICQPDDPLTTSTENQPSSCSEFIRPPS
jgi:hypothetical protein